MFTLKNLTRLIYILYVGTVVVNKSSLKVHKASARSVLHVSTQTSYMCAYRLINTSQLKHSVAFMRREWRVGNFKAKRDSLLYTIIPIVAVHFGSEVTYLAPETYNYIITCIIIIIVIISLIKFHRCSGLAMLCLYVTIRYFYLSVMALVFLRSPSPCVRRKPCGFVTVPVFSD